MKILSLLICASVLGPVAIASPAPTMPAPQVATADVATRVQALNALLAEQWQHTLRNAPEFATILGDLRYNDRWSDASLEHARAEHKVNQDFLRRFEAIDTSGFPDSDKFNQQLMVRQLKDHLRGFDLKLNEMPLEQMSGAHLQLAGFVSSIPFNSTREYEDYLARLHAIPKLLDQVTAVARQGLRDGMMPPRYLLEKVVTQIDSIAKPAGVDSAFGQPLRHFPASVPPADQQRLREAIVAAIDNEVRPAYRKLGQFVAKDYAPHGRSQPGVWQLPNGEAIYRYQVEQMTTTRESPQHIHELGLAEVKRIEAEMTTIAKAQGYPDLASFRAALKKDPKVHPTSREDILNRYRGFIAQMQPQLPKLFGLLPKTRVEVLPVEAYREKEAPGTEYHQGTPDGSRPGQVYVNTGDYANRTTLSIESTAYHEAIPGHHMQISIAQTLPALPPFRQQAGYTAYIEGWALYAERLGKDIGFYKDPLSDYGRLSDELLRADRLVLDTGVHYKRWTRQQMVDFFRAHSSEDEPSIQAETDRYVTWPGQALAYKMGQLKILALRERAKQELGDRFDIRAFHDEILGGGALPLDVLEARTDAWIAAVKAGTAPATAAPVAE
ncbi:hypothetical protein RHOFW104T7_05950 [Rhodanobacter thiooxydans]|uniref:DUF885 domain-containing protein n=1 Tax=Rhodanobacter thiooxydans TaxID=416169 RepID=A0A154QL08_9GAMM|nr:DUF885 family protein [Rhodanobacter thiooxydans]EIL99656.1 X-Pro dipeptidyl-peptidase [Rhodanobacter thiooxydans LCS2]KZC24964.1 hypothetical protein RHOFW104T7_05950 [Rhodanobacter thiooxydans]MCW0203627.1 DUF885 family protein [Rhodanobacter thiooxydans]